MLIAATIYLAIALFYAVTCYDCYPKDTVADYAIWFGSALLWLPLVLGGVATTAYQMLRR